MIAPAAEPLCGLGEDSELGSITSIAMPRGEADAQRDVSSFFPWMKSSMMFKTSLFVKFRCNL
jgi:hypothetical protein